MLTKHYKKGDKVQIEFTNSGTKTVTIKSFYYSYIRNEWIYCVNELKMNIAHSDIWD